MKRFRVRAVTGAVLVLVATGGGRVALAQQPTTQTRNEILQRAASPFEHVSELAVIGDWQGIDAAMKEFEPLRRTTVDTLPSAPRKQFESQLAAINASRERRDSYSLALQAADAYRTLVAAQDARSLTVPIEVSLLDYAGFKLTALLSQTSPDWKAVQATAADARQFWIAVEHRIGDKSLHTLTATTIDGIVRAAANRDRAGGQFAAKVDLDLVDVLEGYFDRIAKSPQR